MHNLWPAWKVSLFAFLFTFIGLIVMAGVIGGGISSDDPRSAGEKVGETYGWICLAAPLLGYVFQKWRIDRAEEELATKGMPDARVTSIGQTGRDEEKK